MNKIEDQIKKFETIKEKIPTTLIPSLIKEEPSISNSLLFYFFKKKHNSSHKNPTKSANALNPNITDNPQEPKQKEKNKFITQKAEEKGKNKTQQGKSHGNTNEQEKNNKGNNNKDADASVKEINLLQIENDNMGRVDLKKMFEKKREEEEKINKEKKINQEKEAGNEEKQPKKEKEQEKEEKQEMQIEEEEENEKKEEPKANENELIIYDANNNTNNMNLHRMESGIIFPNNFNIFNDYKLKDEEYDKDDNEHNFYNEERNKDTFYKKDIFGEKDNRFMMENKEENKEVIQEKKEKEKNEVKIPISENENKSNCLKICITLDEEAEKEKKDKIIIKPLPENKILNSNKKNIPEKLLQNKIKRNSSNEIKKNNANTNANNINNKAEKIIIPSKSKKKVITDDDDGEFILKEKVNTKNIVNKKKEGEPLIKTKGSKIQLLLEPEELKNTKENDINTDNNKSSKKVSEQNDIKINIETEPESKNKKNNNLINKNKNGSQINSTKNSNIYNNYDLSCLNNIHDILISIEEKLSKENKDKSIIKRCFDLIDIVKKTDVNNLIRRKKNTYKNVFNILKLIFIDLGEKKIAKNYNNEIVAILTNVENYYKLVKQNDNEINSIDYFYNRKIAFKYVFSKLELRNCEKDNLKGLYTINKDNTGENNSVITDKNKAIKFIKTFKRYIKTSNKMNQELKAFKKKLNDMEKTNKIKELLDKYEYCGADIQMSPHLMGYNRLFSHFGLIFSFCIDANNKTLLGEPDEQKKKEMNHTNHINDIKKKGKSMQVSKNGFKEKREASMNNIKMKSNK